MKSSTSTLRVLLFAWSVLIAVNHTPTANAEEPHRAGVALATVAPRGLQLREVQAPAHLGLPVHLVYENSQHQLACVVDVLVATSSAGAQEALERWRRAIVQPARPIRGLGDVGYGEANVYGFTLANIMYTLRALTNDIDGARVAEQALAAIRRSSPGSSRGSGVSARVGFQDKNGTLTLTGAALATRVLGEGPLVVRATQDDKVWKLLRTGNGTSLVRIIAVDDRLRQSETLVRP